MARSQAHGKFLEMVNWVDQLIEVHKRVQTGRGRRHHQEAVHRSSVVLLVAAWESYVEHIIIETVSLLKPSAGAPNHSQGLWKIFEIPIRNNIAKFNTPNAENVRLLFKGSLNFDPCSHWCWNAPKRQWDEQHMRNHLNEWLQVRHSIAHGAPLPNLTWLHPPGKPSRLILKNIKDGKKFFSHLVNQTDNALYSFAQSDCGIPSPW